MVAVVSNTGKPLMPTKEYKARKLLKKGRAKIYKYCPFTIMIVDRSDGYIQPIELKCDEGYVHIGISICSEKHEYASTEIQTLTDEKERHKAQKTYRRTRRNRLRFRKARFNNRISSKKKGWIPPSLQHKADINVKWIDDYVSVIPITRIIFEIGTFDTQRLAAIEEGRELPEGEDYQHGIQYDFYSIRDCVFHRDDYTCQCCGKSIKNTKNLVLRTHHVGYKTGDRTNRPGNLLTICDKCHTPANHQPGGKLYNLKPSNKNYADAAYMNTVRNKIVDVIRAKYKNIEIITTYGSKTKMMRKELNVEKSHTNDAYVMGEFHPKHRCKSETFVKTRRNNRVLSKFYDAEYIDNRDGSIKTGKQLFSGVTNRNHKRDTENLHIYRSKKVKKGHVSLRTKKYQFQPKDIVLYNGKKYVINGTNNKGKTVQLYFSTTTEIENITLHKKNKRKDTNPNCIEIGDKVKFSFNGKDKVFTVKKITDKLVTLNGLISTKPEDLTLVRYNNGYKKL